MKGENHIDSFLEMMASERGASRNTIASYRSDLEKFADGGGMLEKRSAGDISRYMAGLSASGLSERSIARKFSALGQFYAFLYSEKIISENPCAGVEGPKTGASLPKFLSESEVTALLLAATGAREIAMLELLYASGLRVSELLGLKRNALRKGGEGVFLLVKGKGGKERMVPVGKKAAEAVAGYLAEHAGDFMFPGKGGKGGMTRQRFGQIMKDLAVKAGVSPDKVSPHVIRHSFASHLLHHGADLRLVQELLGHAQIATTQIYTHVQPGKLKEIVENKHPLGKML